MNEIESRGFQAELVRIKFRRDVMSLPGGTAWLVHTGRLFGFTERFFAPGNFGFPMRLQVMLYRLGY